eukprot:scaffold20852_cov90-Isochrysis_galbana.AAC.1
MNARASISARPSRRGSMQPADRSTSISRSTAVRSTDRRNRSASIWRHRTYEHKRREPSACSHDARSGDSSAATAALASAEARAAVATAAARADAD